MMCLRVDNAPEFLSDCLSEWCRENGVLLQHIRSGKANQNAYIEQFNCTCRNVVLDMYLFRRLDEVREFTGRWMMENNDQRAHDALGKLLPTAYAERSAVRALDREARAGPQ